MGIVFPREEIDEKLEELRNWLDVNQGIESLVDGIFRAIFDFVGWKGQAAEAFIQVITDRIMSKLRPLLDLLQGIIDAVITLLQWGLGVVELGFMGPCEIFDRTFGTDTGTAGDVIDFIINPLSIF